VKELTTYAYASRRHDWYQTLPSSLHESQTQ
jgi:hypothetical protein